jgi:hypothetical protein
VQPAFPTGGGSAAPGSAPLTLNAGEGLAAVCRATNRASITITDLP